MPECIAGVKYAPPRGANQGLNTSTKIIIALPIPKPTPIPTATPKLSQSPNLIALALPKTNPFPIAIGQQKGWHMHQSTNWD